MGSSQGDGTIKKCVAGTYQESSSLGDSLDIKCGFRPSYVTICSIIGSDFSTGATSIYDSRISTTKIINTSGISSVGSAPISTSSNTIKSINDDGFTVGKIFTNFNSNKTVYWQAIE